MESLEVVNIDPTSKEAKFDKAADYSSAVFCNVAKTYPTDAHILCKYKITVSLKANKWDWIGLFRVGWISQNDKITYMYAPLPSGYSEGKEDEGSVMFQSGNLPKEDGEFYQFCYISSSDQVRGASTPFQFRKPGYEEYVEMEDTDVDMLVISSKTVALQENLQKAETERAEIVKKLTAYEADRNSLISKATECEQKLIVEQTKVHELEDALATAQRDTKSLLSQATDMSMVRDELKEKLDKLTKEKDAAVKDKDNDEINIKALQGEIKNLNTEIDALRGKLKNLEEEKELFKSHFSESEGTLQAYTLEIDHLKKASCDHDERTKSLVKENAKMKTDYERKKQKIRKCDEEKKAHEEYIATLSEKVINLEDKNRTYEQQKGLLTDEIMALKEAYEEMGPTLEHTISECHSLKVAMGKKDASFEKERLQLGLELQNLRTNLDGLVKENDDMKTELGSTKDKLVALESQKQDVQEGSLYALQGALSSIKQSYKEQNRQCQDLLQKSKQQNLVQKEQQSTIDDFKQRFEIAKEEYTAKFIECDKLQKSYDKLKLKYNAGAARKHYISVSEETGGILLERDTPQSSSATDTPPNTPQERSTLDEVAISLSSKEIQQQLEVMGQELEERQTKKNKYKKMYQDQRERSDFLEKHYTERYTQYLSEIDETQKKNKELLEHVEEMKTIHAKYEDEMQENRALTTVTSTGMMAVAETVAASTMATARTSNAGTLATTETSSASTMANVETADRFTQLYPNPYKPEEETMQIVRPPPTTNYTYKVTSERISKHTALDSSNGDQESLDKPLTPLPAPIQPEVLPTAKVAAVKAEIGLNNKVQTESESVSAEEMGFSVISSGENTIIKICNESDMTSSQCPPLVHTNDELEDEERFQDAEGEPQKRCPVCHMIFPSNMDQTDFEDHVDSHLGVQCPMCKKAFKDGYSQEEFEEHVQSHFD